MAGLMMVMTCTCRLEYTINIIGLLAVYDIFTLVVASQAYAITKVSTHATD